MNRLLLSIALSLCAGFAFAQMPPANTFGAFQNITPDIRDDISKEQRALMYHEVKQNIIDLARKGVTPKASLQRKTSTIKFMFPLRQAAGFSDHGFYGIANYVDVDPGPGIKDYNCGKRTYNEHMGTDFFTVPFWWKKMDEDAVEIVAAADGIIVARASNKEDRVCQNCPAGAPPECFYWNAVYLQHADGTLSMYGHMKKNSLTNKQVGDAVSRGEFLGIVGSSGNSSGPHLHFEVWTDTTFATLLDPWEGPCNAAGTASMWEEQPPYFQNKILKVMSGSAIPEIKQCYGGQPEKTFEKSTFTKGTDKVYITSFVRDNRVGNPPFKLKLSRPDGATVYDWTLPPYNAYYPYLYFYYEFTPATFQMTGTYTFRLIYDTDTASVQFNIAAPMPLDLVSFAGKATPQGNLLEWETENEVNTSGFEIQRSADGSEFTAIGMIASKAGQRGQALAYHYTDVSPLAGAQFYRLKMLDADGKFTYSHVVKVVNQHATTVKIYPNPAQNVVELSNVSGFRTVAISDLQGKTWLRETIEKDRMRIDISLLPAGVYFVALQGEAVHQNVKLVKRK